PGRGAAQRSQSEARIVGLGVVVQPRAGQVLVAEPGLRGAYLFGAEPAMRVDVAERREEIVQPQSRAQLPRRHARAPVGREQERQGSHEVWCDPQQGAPLAARLEDQPQVAVLEVADAAVDEARGATARAAGDVAL